MDVYDFEDFVPIQKDKTRGEICLRKWERQMDAQIMKANSATKKLEIEFAKIKVKYPFLDKTQQRGKALEKLNIPSVMGKLPNLITTYQMASSDNKKKATDIASRIHAEKRRLSKRGRTNYNGRKGRIFIYDDASDTCDRAREFEAPLPVRKKIRKSSAKNKLVPQIFDDTDDHLSDMSLKDFELHHDKEKPAILPSENKVFQDRKISNKKRSMQIHHESDKENLSQLNPKRLRPLIPSGQFKTQSESLRAKEPLKEITLNICNYADKHIRMQHSTILELKQVSRVNSGNILQDEHQKKRREVHTKNACDSKLAEGNEHNYFLNDLNNGFESQNARKINLKEAMFNDNENNKGHSCDSQSDNSDNSEDKSGDSSQDDKSGDSSQDDKSGDSSQDGSNMKLKDKMKRTIKSSVFKKEAGEFKQFKRNPQIFSANENILDRETQNVTRKNARNEKSIITADNYKENTNSSHYKIPNHSTEKPSNYSNDKESKQDKQSNKNQNILSNIENDSGENRTTNKNKKMINEHKGNNTKIVKKKVSNYKELKTNLHISSLERNSDKSTQNLKGKETKNTEYFSEDADTKSEISDTFDREMSDLSENNANAQIKCGGRNKTVMRSKMQKEKKNLKVYSKLRNNYKTKLSMNDVSNNKQLQRNLRISSLKKYFLKRAAQNLRKKTVKSFTDSAGNKENFSALHYATSEHLTEEESESSEKKKDGQMYNVHKRQHAFAELNNNCIQQFTLKEIQSKIISKISISTTNFTKNAERVNKIGPQHDITNKPLIQKNVEDSLNTTEPLQQEDKQKSCFETKKTQEDLKKKKKRKLFFNSFCKSTRSSETTEADIDDSEDTSNDSSEESDLPNENITSFEASKSRVSPILTPEVSDDESTKLPLHSPVQYTFVGGFSSSEEDINKLDISEALEAITTDLGLAVDPTSPEKRCHFPSQMPDVPYLKEIQLQMTESSGNTSDLLENIKPNNEIQTPRLVNILSYSDESNKTEENSETTDGNFLADMFDPLPDTGFQHYLRPLLDDGGDVHETDSCQTLIDSL